MVTKIDYFEKDWLNESEGTIKMLGSLTNDSLSVKIYPEGRSLGELTWHLVSSLGEMGTAVGLPISNYSEDEKNPLNVNVFIEKYKQWSQEILDSVKTEWNDKMLLETTNMYGFDWERGFTLEVLLRHQAHHRGQMTVLMRQAGLKVPGVYGPSREEWEQMGMQPQN